MYMLIYSEYAYVCVCSTEANGQGAHTHTSMYSAQCTQARTHVHALQTCRQVCSSVEICGYLHTKLIRPVTQIGSDCNRMHKLFCRFFVRSLARVFV